MIPSILNLNEIPRGTGAAVVSAQVHDASLLKLAALSCDGGRRSFSPARRA